MIRTPALFAATAVLFSVALTACQPREAAKPAPPPKPAASVTVSDFSQPMTALGTEPFWSVTIDGTHMTLKRPDQPDLAFEAPGASIEPGKAVWIAKSADGRQMTLTLFVSDCSDGMSDRHYPMVAEVALLNEALHGCAIKTAEMAAQPAP